MSSQNSENETATENAKSIASALIQPRVLGTIAGLANADGTISPEVMAQLRGRITDAVNGMPKVGVPEHDQAGSSKDMSTDQSAPEKSQREVRVLTGSSPGPSTAARARSMSPSTLDRLLDRLSGSKEKKRSRSSSGSGSERASHKKKKRSHSRHRGRRHSKKRRRHHSSSSSSNSGTRSSTSSSSGSSTRSSSHRHRKRKSHKGLPIPETNYQVNKQQLKFNSSLSKKLKKLKDRCTDRKEKEIVSECLSDMKRRQSEVFVADNFGLRVAKQFKEDKGLLGKKDTSKLQQLVLLDSITGARAPNSSGAGSSGIRFRGRGVGGPRGSNNRQTSQNHPPQRNQQRDGKDNSDNEPKPWDECFACGDLGHWRSGCPNRQPPQPGSRRYPNYAGSNYRRYGRR